MMTELRKNGSATIGNLKVVQSQNRDYNTGYSDNGFDFASPVFEVTAGDYFEVEENDGGNSFGCKSSDWSGRSAWFEVEGFADETEYMGMCLYVDEGVDTYSLTDPVTLDPTPEAINWAGMEHNTLLSNPAFNIGNPTRITIPTGVNKVRLDLGLGPYYSGYTVGYNQYGKGFVCQIRKNGTDIIDEFKHAMDNSTTSGYSTRAYQVSGRYYDVSPGDYLEILVGTWTQVSGAADNRLSSRTWCNVEFFNETLTDNTSDTHHRYWRLKGTEAGSYDGGGLAEVEFKAEVGGTDVATGGTASAGSNRAGSLAEYAFNDQTELEDSNFWGGAAGSVAAGTSWIAYDFGSPVYIKEFSITARDGVESDHMWDRWSLEYSDDNVNWKARDFYVDEASWAANEKRSYTSGIYPIPSSYPSRTSWVSRSANDAGSFSINFPVVGKYAILMTGASGGVGSADSNITVTSVGSFSFTQEGFTESDNYAEVTAVTVDVTEAGPADLAFTYQVTDFRRALVVWLLDVDTNLAITYYDGTTYNDATSVSIPVIPGDQVVAISHGRGGTTDLGGIADVELENQVIEGSDMFSAYSESVTTTKTMTITMDGVGTEIDRYTMGAMRLRKA